MGKRFAIATAKPLSLVLSNSEFLNLSNATVLPKLAPKHFNFGFKSCIASLKLQTVLLLCAKGKKKKKNHAFSGSGEK